MPKGSPIYNPDVQSDIDMKNTWKLVNYPSSGNAIISIANTIYVDGINGTSGGQRGTSSAFQTIDQGLAVAQQGDTIIVRPGAYAVSAALVIAISNLTIQGYGATLTATTETTATLLRLTGSGITLEGLTVDGGRISSTSLQNWGTIEVQNSGCNIRNITVRNTIGRAIRLSGNIDVTNISGCDISNFYQGIVTDSITGTGVYHLSIYNNKIHDVWATTAFPGCIKLSNGSGTVAITGSAINNKLWGGKNSNNEAGIEAQGNFIRFSSIGNTISNYRFGISYDSVTEGLINSNTINGSSFCGIEFVQMIGGIASGNVINGLEDDGTTVSGGVGYSFSTNGGSVLANVTIVGGSVVNCLNAVHSDSTSGIYIRDLYTFQPSSGNAPYSFQRGQNISLENTVNDIQVVAAYGVFTEIATGNATVTSFYYRNNTFRYSVGGTLYTLFQFYSSDTTGTINDIIISGNRATPDGSFWGSGIISSNGPILNAVYNNNLPVNSSIFYGFPPSPASLQPSVTFTPSATGWYRIVNCGAGEIVGQALISSISSATQDECSILFTTSAYTDVENAIIQLSEFQSHYNPPAITQVRCGNNGASFTVLDVYANITGNPVTISFPLSDLTNHGSLISGSIVSPPTHNPTTTSYVLTTVTLYQNKYLLVNGVSFESQSNKGQISGYASLDGSGKVPAAQLPTLSGGTIASTLLPLAGDNSGNAIAASVSGSGAVVLVTGATLVTPTLGVATATSLDKWIFTAPATAATLTAGADSLTYTMPEITTKIGFRHIPQNSQSAAYTTVLNDSGKHIYHPASDANARTFTIDSNANVAYPIGTAITFANLSANTVSIAITADTMYLAGTGTTGTRALAQYGTATALKTNTTEWVIQGVGLS